MSDDPQSGWTLWLAVWGAVTGTIACSERIRTWWHDRAKLEVEVEVAPISLTTPEMVANWFIEVTNTGRRSASIRSAYIVLRKSWLRTERHVLFSSLEGELAEGQRVAYRPIMGDYEDWDHSKPIIKFVLVDTLRRKWGTRKVKGADLLLALATMKPVEELVDPGGLSVLRFQLSHGPVTLDLVRFSLPATGGGTHEWFEWYRTEAYARSRFNQLIKAPAGSINPDSPSEINKLVGLASRHSRIRKP